MSDSPSGSHKVALTGVSETALLTLNARATEARRGDDRLIDDPMAVQLVDSIDFDFAKFGPTRQDIAIRAQAFDRAAKAYLSAHPAATVVALAEGLQTSFWRLDAALPQGQFRWLTVDLPPVIDIRKRLLPSSPRISVLAQSALDYSWMDSVDSSNGVFITAEGLLMYLQPEQSLGLIAECAKRFPGGQMLFDLPPRWFSVFSRLGIRTSLRYKVPAMPFSLSPAEAADLAATVPGVTAVHDVRLPKGRGLIFNTALSAVYHVALLDPLRPNLTLLEF
ncbi:MULTISPECIES: class I SAM-dependent methyltransferase [unclassified Mycobacterium]|uniref:class I SAM-dependent methyltransferase n=1 Tax=unclassified Mycobacterium TaxID=2642494 RepID=UPI00274044BE|nr:MULTISPECIES: class I SAM-dependent methyltransferase [unclassified Mycobacterium]MDP7705566.1 class I SAM-dependent methyltransferase [Mycobacterium sp. TY815]MDP7725013.1 class I SAM-dependent methyltransferase [Mycobacterium sp. TY814]